MSLWMHFTFRGCHPSGQRLALTLEAPTMSLGTQWRIINEQPTLEVFTWQAWQAGQLVGCVTGESSGAGTAGTLLSGRKEGALCLALGGAKNRAVAGEGRAWSGKEAASVGAPLL